jgi:hypothetical protein
MMLYVLVNGERLEWKGSYSTVSIKGGISCPKSEILLFLNSFFKFINIYDRL